MSKDTNKADILFTCDKRALEHYCDVFGIPDFKSKEDYIHFIDHEIPGIELRSGKEYYIIPRLKKLRAPKSSFRR
jgi:hypothetical protein